MAFEQANEVNAVFLLEGISIFAVFFKGGVGGGQVIVSWEEGDEDRLSDDRNAQNLFYFHSENIIMPGWWIILCLFVRYEFNFFARVFCSDPHVAKGNSHANPAHPFKHKGC